MRPQTARHDDTLLLVAEWMTLLLMLLVGIAMIALAIAGTVLFLDRANQFAEPAAQAVMSVEGFALLVVLGMAGGLVLLTLGMRFLQTMLEIIRSVGKGDPFVSANAARLRAMAWLLLAIQLGGLALGIYGQWLGKFSDSIHFKSDFSMSGLVGVLALFVLARDRKSTSLNSSH